MKILILNGSPRPNGNTAALVAAFAEGAQANGNSVTVFDVCKKQIAGCRGCESSTKILVYQRCAA